MAELPPSSVIVVDEGEDEEDTDKLVDMLAGSIEQLMLEQQKLMADLRNAQTAISFTKEARSSDRGKRWRRRDDEDCERKRVMRSMDSSGSLSEESTVRYSGMSPNYRGMETDEDEDDMPVYRGLPGILKSSSGPPDEFDSEEIAISGDDDPATFRSMEACSGAGPKAAVTSQLDLRALRELAEAFQALTQQGANAEESAIRQQLSRLHKVLCC